MDDKQRDKDRSQQPTAPAEPDPQSPPIRPADDDDPPPPGPLGVPIGTGKNP